ASPAFDPSGPFLELRLRIVAPAAAGAVVEADVRPVAGELVRLERPPRVVADDECGAVGPQQFVHVRNEPALVPELEAVAPGRKLRKPAREPLDVSPEVARELPEHRSELRR